MSFSQEKLKIMEIEASFISHNPKTLGNHMYHDVINEYHRVFEVYHASDIQEERTTLEMAKNKYHGDLENH
jgi:hypothetical protein